MNNAEQYLNDMVANLERLQAIIWDHGDDVTSHKHYLRVNDPDAHAWVMDNLPDLEYSSSISSAYLEGALQIYAKARIYPGGSTEIRSVVAVMTAGGPHCELSADGSDGVRVDVWWGSDHCYRYVDAPDVATTLNDMF